MGGRGGEVVLVVVVVGGVGRGERRTRANERGASLRLHSRLSMVIPKMRWKLLLKPLFLIVGTRSSGWGMIGGLSVGGTSALVDMYIQSSLAPIFMTNTVGHSVTASYAPTLTVSALIHTPSCFKRFLTCAWVTVVPGQAALMALMSECFPRRSSSESHTLVSFDCLSKGISLWEAGISRRACHTTAHRSYQRWYIHGAGARATANSKLWSGPQRKMAPQLFDVSRS